MFGNKTDKIVVAIGELSEAKRVYEEAYRTYGGCSWGYYGSDYQTSIEEAEKSLGEALNEYIDARVEEALNRRA